MENNLTVAEVTVCGGGEAAHVRNHLSGLVCCVGQSGQREQGGRQVSWCAHLLGVSVSHMQVKGTL